MTTMPQFRYIANRDGVSERGMLEAPSKSAALKRLKSQGYAAIRVRRGGADTGNLLQRLLGR